MMVFKRAAENRGFTLVELLLVIVLVAILMAIITLSGFNMMTSTNAQTEVRRIIRTVHALRSAWIACYADTHQMIGVPEGSWSQASIDAELSKYSDRNLDDEKHHYGNILVKVNTLGPRGTYIGFAARHSGNEVWDKSPSTREIIIHNLEAQADDYGLHLDFTSTSNDVFIRIK